MKILISLLIFISTTSFAWAEENVEREYYENGSIKTEIIITDKEALKGLIKSYHPNGKLAAEGQLLDVQGENSCGWEGLPIEGDLREYDENGNLTKTTIFRNNCDLSNVPKNLDECFTKLDQHLSYSVNLEAYNNFKESSEEQSANFGLRGWIRTMGRNNSRICSCKIFYFA